MGLEDEMEQTAGYRIAHAAVGLNLPRCRLLIDSYSVTVPAWPVFRIGISIWTVEVALRKDKCWLGSLDQNVGGFHGPWHGPVKAWDSCLAVMSFKKTKAGVFACRSHLRLHGEGSYRILKGCQHESVLCTCGPYCRQDCVHDLVVAAC